MHLLIRERNVNATNAGVGWSFIPNLLLCQQLPVNLQLLKRIVVVFSNVNQGSIVFVME